MFPIMGATNPTGYNLTRSLRFRSSASAYLNKTFSTTATSRQKITISAWVKRGALGAISGSIIEGDQGATYYSSLFFTNDLLYVAFGGSSPYYVATTQVFRDPSAWYHIVASIDSTQATASNRVIIYVNGVQITALSIANYPPQNSNFGWLINATGNKIGSNAANSASFFDGYIAEMNVIDGQALTPSSFGSTNTLTGVWQPARYTGTYGTNGFYLPFTDNSALTTSSNAGLGKDFSGNGNYWVTNNISITSGVTYDSMTDVPTLTSPTVANFCVLNPINKSPSSTVSNGNLRQTSSGGWYRAYSTIFFASTAAFYAEATMTALNSGSNGVRVGVANANSVFTYLGSDANSWSYDNQGNKYNNGSLSAYGASYVQGDVIGILLNNGSLTFYKNGVSQGVAYSGLTGTFCFAGSPFDTDTVDWNFGQRPFAYSLPSGALALNTFNLPDSTIVKGNTVMDATLYTGNSSGGTVTNAAGFKPDFVWMKDRSAARNNELLNSVTGGSSTLFSNLTNAQATDQRISSFNSNGFTYTSNSNSANTGESFVGWQWQAGQGTTSTNTSGSITSTVSVNATAGFSIVSYTGTGANATVGHGLGVAPQFIITKNRSATSAWHCYVAAIPNMQNGYIVLNTTDAFSTSTNTVWNGIQPTSTVFSVGTDTGPNGSGNAEIAYCFTSIAGFSSFGSYVGNGLSDGPFVYTGFRPKYLLIKSVYLAQNWTIFDTSRSPYNAADLLLYPMYSNAENQDTGQAIDLVSNGFKIRNSNANENTSGQTYIFAAFAENPFKNALAR